MNVKYKISYLSDGTKVKITNQLFNKIKEWEENDMKISAVFLDELKMQDNDWIKSTRNYYLNNVAMQSLPYHAFNEEKSLRVKNFQYKSNNKIVLECLMSKLSQCTETQKRRFLLYYYYDLTFMEISEIEGKSRLAVRESVKKALKLLTNDEQFEKHPNK